MTIDDLSRRYLGWTRLYYERNDDERGIKYILRTLRKDARTDGDDGANESEDIYRMYIARSTVAGTFYICGIALHEIYLGYRMLKLTRNPVGKRKII